MLRYSARSATSGAITLNSARKGGSTQTYWFFLKAGDGWIEFDVRILAQEMGASMPALATAAELESCKPADFEKLLQRDLQRVADFCASVDALKIINEEARAA